MAGTVGASGGPDQIKLFQEARQLAPNNKEVASDLAAVQGATAQPAVPTEQSSLSNGAQGIGAAGPPGINPSQKTQINAGMAPLLQKLTADVQKAQGTSQTSAVNGSSANDPADFMLGILKSGTSPTQAAQEANQKFGLKTGGEAVFYPDSNTIGLPSCYLAGPTNKPDSPKEWCIVKRSGGGGGGSAGPSAPASSPATSGASGPSGASGASGATGVTGTTGATGHHHHHHHHHHHDGATGAGPAGAQSGGGAGHGDGGHHK